MLIEYFCLFLYIILNAEEFQNICFLVVPGSLITTFIICEMQPDKKKEAYLLSLNFVSHLGA